MCIRDRAWSESEENPIQVEVEFLGEVLESADGRMRFQSGISTFPVSYTHLDVYKRQGETAKSQPLGNSSPISR